MVKESARRYLNSPRNQKKVIAQELADACGLRGYRFVRQKAWRVTKVVPNEQVAKTTMEKLRIAANVLDKEDLRKEREAHAAHLEEQARRKELEAEALRQDELAARREELARRKELEELEAEALRLDELAARREELGRRKKLEELEAEALQLDELTARRRPRNEAPVYDPNVAASSTLATASDNSAIVSAPSDSGATLIDAMKHLFETREKNDGGVQFGDSNRTFHYNHNETNHQYFQTDNTSTFDEINKKLGKIENKIDSNADRMLSAVDGLTPAKPSFNYGHGSPSPVPQPRFDSPQAAKMPHLHDDTGLQNDSDSDPDPVLDPDSALNDDAGLQNDSNPDPGPESEPQNQKKKAKRVSFLRGWARGKSKNKG
jgi:hypothetical protein